MLPLLLREPVILAKQLSTLDYLSAGRVVLGAGLGIRDEVSAVKHMPYSGARMDEMLRLMKLLWTQRSAEFSGRFYEVKGSSSYKAGMEPKPLQDGGPKILIAGDSDAALRRAARNDGWIEYVGTDPVRFGECWNKLREYSKLLGKDPSSLEAAVLTYAYVGSSTENAKASCEYYLTRYFGQPWENIVKRTIIGTPTECVERTRQFVDAGARTIILGLPVFDVEQLELFYREIMPAFIAR